MTTPAPGTDDAPRDSAAPDASERRAGDDFLEQAARPGGGIASEFWVFLKENKKWWLAPLLIAFAVVGALIVFGSSAAGPFVYTLF